MSCTGIENRSVFVFCDGLRDKASASDRQSHNETVNIIEKYRNDWWQVEYSALNLGLAKSVYNGVTHVLNTHKSAIVLEDDLIFAKDFLLFMDECLEKFENSSGVFSISGFSHLHKKNTGNPSVFLYPRPGSWGWATWSNRWNGFGLGRYNKSVFRNHSAMDRFDQGGADMSWMLRRCVNGKVDSWAIQWAYYQFLNGGYSVYPECSKVKNLGFRKDATHTKAAVGQNHDWIEERSGEICEEPIIVNENISADREKILMYSENYPLGFWTGMVKKVYQLLGI